MSSAIDSLGELQKENALCKSEISSLSAKFADLTELLISLNPSSKIEDMEQKLLDVDRRILTLSTSLSAISSAVSAAPMDLDVIGNLESHINDSFISLSNSVHAKIAELQELPKRLSALNFDVSGLSKLVREQSEATQTLATLSSG